MPERALPRVSVVINNYNYARFLVHAIDSALRQSDVDCEVVVVDDGSTDESRDVIGRYAGRVTQVLKENGGQASAFHAGLAVSTGEAVIFLDADDVLAPSAAREAAQLFAAFAPAKVHWPLRMMDSAGRLLGRLRPERSLPDGDLRDVLVRHGPSVLISPPTSGNAWARWFLERVLPIPDEYTLCADDYLYALAPAFGLIKRVAQPQGCYRLHENNHYLSRSFEQRLALGLRAQAQQRAALSRMFAEQGIKVDMPAWLAASWFERVQRACGRLQEHVPRAASLILVDDDQWGAGEQLFGRRRFHFVERHGRYFGPPANDAAALQELQRLRGAGAHFIAFAWPSSWWLDHYRGLRRELETQHRLVLADDALSLYELQPMAAEEGGP